MQNYIFCKKPINSLTSISAIRSKKLAKIGLYTVQDLLFHFPIRYEDHTHFCKIKNLIPGIYSTIEGKVVNCNILSRRRKIFTYQISDGSGILNICFFNLIESRKKLVVGQSILVYGEAKHSKYGIEMIHPECQVKNNFNVLNSKKLLTPIYPTTKGLTQEFLRELIDIALNLLDFYCIDELLPNEVAQGMMSLKEAFRTLHRPSSYTQITDLNSGKNPAKRRLIFEELLAYNLSMLALRANVRCFSSHSIHSNNDNLKSKFLNLLPFKLTRAQERVVSEIERDMKRDFPMMRLIQGDVGSGKTIVAAIAALQVISNGKQVAMMVPTDILVEQHIKNFQNWFTPIGVKVGWLTGKQKKRIRLVQQDSISKGITQMLVGTHAIFQEKVQFHDLALIIIDEQHRFGVHQRLALRKKGLNKGYHPHQLIMTATPIPRTIAMTTYADLDVSIIDELPSGRASITTVVIPDIKREELIRRLQNACVKDGRQGYWVCTLIDKSDLMAAKSAKVTWEELKATLPDLNIGLIHGKMKPLKKQEVMQQFKEGILHILVSTTVIEVGMDVPNASIMIIENPERLGLAQLHQLRGRVGRGIISSYCILLYKSSTTKKALNRLQVLRNNSDGFVIAQKDLETRGPGELLGTRQTGKTDFKVVNLLRDHDILPEVYHIARYIHEQYPALEKKLINRWISKKNKNFFKI